MQTKANVQSPLELEALNAVPTDRSIRVRIRMEVRIRVRKEIRKVVETYLYPISMCSRYNSDP